MQERFTGKADEALKRAAIIAKEFGHGYVGTEHILLGLLHDVSDVQFVFKEMGITLENAKETVSQQNKAADIIYTNIISYTTKAKSVFQRCMNKVKLLGTDVINTEDIAVSLLKDKDCEAVKCIVQLGGKPDELINTFNELYGGDKEQPAQKETEKPEKSTSILQKYTNV